MSEHIEQGKGEVEELENHLNRAESKWIHERGLMDRANFNRFAASSLIALGYRKHPPVDGGANLVPLDKKALWDFIETLPLDFALPLGVQDRLTSAICDKFGNPDTKPLVEALKRIIGLCGKRFKCSCGSPTGLGAIISCAEQALAKFKGGQ